MTPIYCLRCRKKKEMMNLHGDRTMHGQPFIKGQCKSCKNECRQFVKESDIKEGGFLSSLFKAIGLGMKKRVR